MYACLHVMSMDDEHHGKWEIQQNKDDPEEDTGGDYSNYFDNESNAKNKEDQVGSWCDIQVSKLINF